MQAETRFGAIVLVASMAIFVAGLGLATAQAGAAAPAGNAAKGKALFSTCAGCHDLTTTAKIGPPLKGVVGRKAGSVAGFSYSPAMQKAGVAWTPEKLDQYLAGPTAMVPGSRMGIRITDAQKRADIIAYLRTLR